MKKLIAAFLLSVVPAVAFASGGDVHLDHANVDLRDQASLQRGAKLFAEYCMGCHGLKYARYERVGNDIGMTADEVKNQLIVAGGKIGDLMKTSMTSADAEKYFGTVVPDLTLVARLRGADWVYTYLRSFYLDDKRPFGVNNILFPDVGMPHVLAGLQGVQKAVFKEEPGPDGHPHKVFEKFEQATPGKLSPGEYDAAVRDLTAYLTYMAEPMKLERQSLGIKVMLFLVLFFVLAYFLKKEYWKDVH
jgi:ubiquinol-cytochrome c reductase cytochrome c1 subunit